MDNTISAITLNFIIILCGLIMDYIIVHGLRIPNYLAKLARNSMYSFSLFAFSSISNSIRVALIFNNSYNITH